MKMKGRSVKPPLPRIVPILRSEEEGGNYYFTVQAIVDFDAFFATCPYPKAPIMQLPGGKTKEKVDDKGFQALVDAWWKKRAAWITIESLKLSDIEWETVDLNNSDTWERVHDELAKDLTWTEHNTLLNCIGDMNSLNEAKMEEARQSFLNGRSKAQEELPSPTVEQKSS